MPMDNNDNHYPGLGEENSKITSILLPYGLPKFDFDHTHIRFDSLAENEVFLGISGREDDHWIEDFSRGNSGIEFGSSAAECSSIPRHVDVWSEATSSESVEMLLKSVGQEEMLPGESTIERSDACDELGTLEKQMELILRPDVNRNDQDSNRESPGVLPSDNSSGSNQGSEDVDIDPKCPSSSQVEHSASGVSVNLENSVVACEWDSQDNESSNPKPLTSLNDSLNYNMEGNPVLTQRCSDSSSQYVREYVEFSIGEDRPSSKPLEDASSEPRQKNDCDVNDASSCSIPDTNHPSVSKFSVSAFPNARVTQNFEELSSIPTKEESSLPTEGNGQDIHSVESCQTFKDLALPESLEIIHSTDVYEQSFGESDGDVKADKPAASIVGAGAHGVDVECEQSKDIPSLTSHTESYVESKDSSQGSHIQVDKGLSPIASEGKIHGAEPEPGSHVTEDQVNHDSVPILADTSQSAQSVDVNVAEYLNERNDTAENHENSVLSSISSEIVMSVEAAISGKQDPGDTSPNLYNDVAREKLPSWSLDEDVKIKIDMEQSLESDSPSAIKPELNVGNGSNEISHATTDDVAEKNEELNLPSDVEPMHLDKTEDTVSGVVLEEDTPSMKFASQVESGTCIISLAERNLASNISAEEVIQEDSSLPSTEIRVASLNEVVLVHGHPKETPGLSDTVDVDSSVPCDSLEISHATTDAIAEKNEELNLPSDVEPTHLGKADDTVAGVALEEETPIMTFASQVESETHIVSLAERNLASNVSAEEVIQEDPSVPSAEIRASLNEVVLIHVHPKETLGLSDTVDLDNSVPCDSNVVVADGTDAVPVVEHMETNCQAELLENSGGGCFAEAEKPSHNTASVVFGSKLPEHDERMKSDHMEAVAEHVSDITSKADEVPSLLKNDGASDRSGEGRNFSFDVPPMAEKESGSIPRGSQKNRGGRKGPQVTVESESGSASIGAKTASDRKTRRGSAKSTRKNAKKGNGVGQPDDHTTCTLGTQSGLAGVFQFGIGISESSGLKPTASPIPASNLPDLNTSIPTSAHFHQSFTDSQQVQLRAQIFVYGSLIQGTAPDEACMVAAFGSSDAGRSSWEPLWRVCVERLHSHNTASKHYSTPIQSHSGSTAQDKSSKKSAPRRKVVHSPVSIFANVETPSVTVKPMIPPSSPLWNLSTPSSDGLPLTNVVREEASLALPPVHPCLTPPARTLVGQATSWLSPAPIPGSRVSTSRSSPFDLSSHYSSSQPADMVKLTLLSDSSLAISNSMHAFNAPISHGSVSGNLVDDSSMQKLASSPADSKSRKRRKSNIIEETPQNSLLAPSALPYSDTVASISSNKAPVVARLSSISSHPNTSPIGGHFSTTVAVTASPVVSVDPTQRRELHMEKNSIHMEELKQVEKAKLHGEEAMAHAADLVSRCQSIWSALEEQRNSSLVLDHQLQLSSSAAAVAAAASVAKAAAAAAKLASTAAVHFHQVAIEVLNGNAIPPQESEIPIPYAANNLSDATPAAILRGGNGSDAPNSIIFAAREAAKRRVEAALAASQNAENLDAIVKAAELAADAVSQAGRVVAMGIPVPLSVLLEAGPENYWRADLQPEKRSTEKGDEKDIGSSKETFKQSEGPSGLEVCPMVKDSSLPKDVVGDVGVNIRVDETISASHVSCEKGISGKKGSPAPDHAGAISLASDCDDAESVPLQDDHACSQKTVSVDGITENCTVEVFKDGKGAWYLAKVLSLNDEKALVCFTDLRSDKESDPLREWIPLEGEGDKFPIIRVTHPISGVHSDRTRKRGRAALREYQWSVGDRVDAWSEDCWREGVIMEQNNKDPTTFTVHFPALGNTSVIKAWHLRHTLTWKDGKWIELITSRQTAPSQGDTPLGKRLRLGSVQDKGKGEIPKTVDSLQLGNVDEPKSLSLSSTEQVFNIGSNGGDNKVDAPRMMRSGLQKEGLKFFGVPRPGRKRKFMEVSKHIGSEQSTKNDVPNDSSKLSKYLMPRGTGSRGFKFGSKVEVKDKQLAESKLKAPNTSKVPGISSLTPSQKENSTTAVSGSREITSRGTVKGSISNNVRGPSNLTRSGSGSNHEAASDMPVWTPSRRPDRKASKNLNYERPTKGKLVAAGGRTEAAAEDKLLPDSTGPRRSNRKIQPTSRLLEGLQSSLIPSKIAAASLRFESKGSSRGTSNRH